MSKASVDYVTKILMPDIYTRLTGLEIRVKALEEVKQKNE